MEENGGVCYGVGGRVRHAALCWWWSSSSRGGGNRIVTLLDGAGIRPGRVDEPVDHYRLLATMYGVPALGHAADTTPITGIWTSG